MARIYQTRQLLDPQLMSNMNNVAQQRYANEVARRKPVMDSLNTMFSSVGKTFDDSIARYNREQEVSKWDLPTNDPYIRAAREEYIRTGSSSPLLNYQMQKLAAEQRAADAAQRKIDEEKDKKWRLAVRIGQARPEYSKILKDMNKSIDEGDLETAEIYKQQLEALENEFGSDVFGPTAQSMLDTRAKQKQLADEKRAQEEADKQELELGEKNLKTIQDINEQERLYNVEQFLSTLPTVFKTDAEKQPVYDLIKANEDMTTAEKTEIMKKIRETESGETAKKKAKQGAVAGKAGEATGKVIDEKTEKKKLADAGRAAIAAGRQPTRAQQKAIDEGN